MGLLYDILLNCRYIILIHHIRKTHHTTVLQNAAQYNILEDQVFTRLHVVIKESLKSVSFSSVINATLRKIIK